MFSISERLGPEKIRIADDRTGKAWNAGLGAQASRYPAKSRQYLIARRRQGEGAAAGVRADNRRAR